MSPLIYTMNTKNRKLKDVVSGVGANVTEELIVEASKSLHAVDTICQHYDTTTGIRPDSVHHTKKVLNRT